MTRKSLGAVGGIEILAPLGVDEERALYPLIQRGRQAQASLSSGVAHDPKERRSLLRARQEGQEAETLLLRSTCGLVRARVNERGYRFGNEDLEAAGLEGLVNALHRFDPSKGARFSTYANYWIMKLVNLAIQQQLGLSDAEMRHILSFQKLERARPTSRLTKRDVAAALKISQSKATEVIQMSRDLNNRRYETADIDNVPESSGAVQTSDAPSWVIDELHRLCGRDFDAFWQYTFRTMSIEEIARQHGISRQAMSKRIERCRRAVIESPEAKRLEAWFDRQ